jgi:hypothetical protein
MSTLLRTPRRKLAAALVLLVLAVLSTATGVLAARPARVLGVSGRALGYSVARHTGGVSLAWDVDACRRTAPRAWRCDVSSDGSSGLTYRVRVDSRGCWTARRVGPADGIEPAPRRAAGCIGVRDYVRFVQRALGAAPGPPR